MVAITGAHNVGKTTFCVGLQKHLQTQMSLNSTILDCLGDRMRSLGVPLGKTANSDAVAAIYAAHLSREESAPNGIVLLDRCVIDAFAYVQSLGVNSPAEQALYKEISNLASKRLDLIIHLELTEFFYDMCADHETPELRSKVASAIQPIMNDLSVPSIRLDAKSSDSISVAAKCIHILSSQLS